MQYFSSIKAGFRLWQTLTFAIMFSTLSVMLSASAQTPPKNSESRIFSTTDRAVPPATVRLRKQVRGPGQKLHVDPRLKLDLVASGLGNIAALTSMGSTLYTSDIQSGRIFVLSDRESDGRVDIKRPLSHFFQSPSGLAASDDHLFIADQSAIWRFDPKSQQVTFFVSLSNTGALITPRPLMVDRAGQRLLIGLNTRDAGKTNTAKIIAVDLMSGQATHITEISRKGLITSLSSLMTGAGQPSEIWAGIGDHIYRLRATGPSAQYPVEAGVQIAGLYLPAPETDPDNWPEFITDHILVSQGGQQRLAAHTSGGVNIVAVPTRLGVPQPEVHVLVSGFLNERGQAAWGHPGMMIADTHGLVFADPWQGQIWRLSGKAEPTPILSRAPSPEPVIAEDTEQATPTAPARFAFDPDEFKKIDPLRPAGSGITRGSTLAYGSGLTETEKTNPDRSDGAETQKDKTPAE